jgi:hypothetical protein
LLVGDGVNVGDGFALAVRVGFGGLVEGFLVAALSGTDVLLALNLGVFVSGRSAAVVVAVDVAGGETMIATAEAIRVGVGLFPPFT